MALAFAVYSAAAHGGKFTVRARTAQAALACARALIDRGSMEVKIAVAATGDQFDPDQFENAVMSGRVPIEHERGAKRAAVKAIDAKFQSH